MSDSISLLSHYFNAQKDSADAFHKEAQQYMTEGIDVNSPSFNYNFFTYIYKLYQTPNVVTYAVSRSIYMGGAHPMSAFYAVSFDCRNPKRLGYEMLRDTTASNTELYSLIKDGLKKYFEVQTDEELNEMLLSDDFNEGSTNRIPLPVFPPYIENNQLHFVYQQYEIAPYAAGMPEAIISIEDIIPQLTNEAALLFSKN